VSTPAPTSTTAPTATPGAAQRLDLAKRLLDDGKIDQALPLLEALRLQDPSTPGLDDALVRAYVTRGQAALDQNDLDASSASFEKALTLRGDDENALTGRKRVEARRAWTRMEAAWGKDDDAVVEALEAVRRNDPQYRSADVRDKLYVVRLGRADNLQKAGDLEGAAAELQRAVDVDPERPEAKLRLQALTPTPTPVPPTATPVPYVPPAAPPRQQQQPVAPAAAPRQQAPAQQAPAPAPAPAPSAPRNTRPAPSVSDSPL
jgi:tetratricopeptide (TPR) repeat protein